MNDIEILEYLEKMQKTFIEEGLQGYEMVIVNTKNFINSLIQRNKDLEQIEKEHKEENGRLRDRIKELEEIANWHIEHLTETIADYIDDDRIGNRHIIGEFKESREHWKDIIRILKNEKTYIDYKNY